jgi:hypothetical protein
MQQKKSIVKKGAQDWKGIGTAFTCVGIIAIILGGDLNTGLGIFLVGLGTLAVYSIMVPSEVIASYKKIIAWYNLKFKKFDFKAYMLLFGVTLLFGTIVIIKVPSILKEKINFIIILLSLVLLAFTIISALPKLNHKTNEEVFMTAIHLTDAGILILTATFAFSSAIFPSQPSLGLSGFYKVLTIYAMPLLAPITFLLGIYNLIWGIIHFRSMLFKQEHL